MANILVVDDEIGIRELLSEILGDEGHVVFAAENAAQARSLRTAEPIDLVLLDIWMPECDGITLLKEWVAQRQLSMPVIMMSGHATIDTAVEATRYGALDFLEKPITMQKLLAAVQKGLARSQLNRLAQSTATTATTPSVRVVPVEPMAAPLVSSPIATAPRVGVAPAAPAVAPFPIDLDLPLREARDEFERLYFEHHLSREHGSMTRVAERTGLERTHLYRKLKQLGVELTRGSRRGEAAAAAPAAPVQDAGGGAAPDDKFASFPSKF